MISPGPPLVLAALLENLPAAVAFAEAEAAAAGVPPARLPGLALALEEAFVNICNYAFPEGGGTVSLAAFAEGDLFVLEIMDPGLEFNMLSVPDPDISAGIDERKIGGLGVHFIRHFVDQTDWRRENGRNILRLKLYR